MGAGRFVCVALPLGLTIASIVCILIAMLAGITDKNLALFEVRTQNLSVSSSELQNLVNVATRDLNSALTARDLDLSRLTNEALNRGNDLVNGAAENGVDAATAAIAGGDITASTLGLADSYKVALWNYCAFTDGKRNCTSAKFDWASSKLNTTDSVYTVNGQTTRVSLPKDIQAALRTFTTVSRWTQVVYIIAIIAAAVELVFGIFAICSRMGSCCTSIVSSISTTAILVASILATVQSTVVTGAVKSTARAYNVNASINNQFLAVTWLAVAFSIGAGLFWLFTTCCCAADHSSNKSSGSSRGFMNLGGKRGSTLADQEKLIPTGSYQRVGDDNTAYHGQSHGVYNNGKEYGVPMQPVARGGNGGAYEPFSHTRV